MATILAKSGAKKKVGVIRSLLYLVRSNKRSKTEKPTSPAAGNTASTIVSSFRPIPLPEGGDRQTSPTPATVDGDGGAPSGYAAGDGLFGAGAESWYEGEGDEMIDAKAEEFIARFYQQMRSQQAHPVDVDRHDMI